MAEEQQIKGVTQTAEFKNLLATLGYADGDISRFVADLNAIAEKQNETRSDNDKLRLIDEKNIDEDISNMLVSLQTQKLEGKGVTLPVALSAAFSVAGSLVNFVSLEDSPRATFLENGFPPAWLDGDAPIKLAEYIDSYEAPAPLEPVVAKNKVEPEKPQVAAQGVVQEPPKDVKPAAVTTKESFAAVAQAPVFSEAYRAEIEAAFPDQPPKSVQQFDQLLDALGYKQGTLDDRFRAFNAELYKSLQEHGLQPKPAFSENILSVMQSRRSSPRMPKTYTFDEAAPEQWKDAQDNSVVKAFLKSPKAALQGANDYAQYAFNRPDLLVGQALQELNYNNPTSYICDLQARLNMPVNGHVSEALWQKHMKAIQGVADEQMLVVEQDEKLKPEEKKYAIQAIVQSVMAQEAIGMAIAKLQLNGTYKPDPAILAKYQVQKPEAQAQKLVAGTQEPKAGEATKPEEKKLSLEERSEIFTHTEIVRGVLNTLPNLVQEHGITLFPPNNKPLESADFQASIQQVTYLLRHPQVLGIPVRSLNDNTFHFNAFQKDLYKDAFNNPKSPLATMFGVEFKEEAAKKGFTFDEFIDSLAYLEEKGLVQKGKPLIAPPVKDDVLATLAGEAQLMNGVNMVKESTWGKGIFGSIKGIFLSMLGAIGGMEKLQGISNMIPGLGGIFKFLGGIFDLDLGFGSKEKEAPVANHTASTKPEAQPTQQVVRNSAPASPDHLNPTDPQASGLAATFHSSVTTGSDATFDPNQNPEDPSHNKGSALNPWHLNA